MKENIMSQSSHDQAAELHNLASHAHAAAAVAHAKADQRTAHELSKQAFELSRNALKHSEQLYTATDVLNIAGTDKNENAKAVRINRPGLPL
jgi:hypothetical protein